ncbi:kinase-like domain-containing protein [Phlebopus sp. FC_14]|nr:kinase-like domain-containing protein [Phlebopus sp. FC_14]
MGPEQSHLTGLRIADESPRQTIIWKKARQSFLSDNGRPSNLDPKNTTCFPNSDFGKCLVWKFSANSCIILSPPLLKDKSMASTSSVGKTATQTLLDSSQLVSQGAEAKCYKAYLRDQSSTTVGSMQHVVYPQASAVEPVLLKYRFNKHYRHPSLDASLTRQRIAGEARALMRCLRSGVNVPGIRMVDSAGGVLGIEWIDGKIVRALLPGGAEEEESIEKDTQEGVDPLVEFEVTRDTLMSMIGIEIAKMHLADIIHGDLTTSNIMLRRGSNDLVLIDFGLAFHSILIEDKAVDLYVLERAFASTHPDSEPLFASVLASYGDRMGRHWIQIKRRLDDVRLRGRKRSMVG